MPTLRRCDGAVAMARTAVIAGLVSAAFGQPARGMTAGELQAQCQTFTENAAVDGSRIELPSDSRAHQCFSYFSAILDLSYAGNGRGSRALGICVPARGSATAFVATFLDYMRRRAAEPDAPSGKVVPRALREAYPCPDDL